MPSFSDPKSNTIHHTWQTDKRLPALGRLVRRFHVKPFELLGGQSLGFTIRQEAQYRRFYVAFPLE